MGMPILVRRIADMPDPATTILHIIWFGCGGESTHGWSRRRRFGARIITIAAKIMQK
jgi:hypothetical protein